MPNVYKTVTEKADRGRAKKPVSSAHATQMNNAITNFISYFKAKHT